MSSITTGRDDIWYAIVTITTAEYGDYYPVTNGGRVTAMFLMSTDVSIIGAPASLLSSILVGSLHHLSVGATSAKAALIASTVVAPGITTSDMAAYQAAAVKHFQVS